MKLGVGSLLRWAKEDNETLYNEIQKKKKKKEKEVSIGEGNDDEDSAEEYDDDAEDSFKNVARRFEKNYCKIIYVSGIKIMKIISFLLKM